MEVWFLLGLVIHLGKATPFGSEIGMRMKRAEDRVTIDLSALRPSLPGLVLYKYGELAPKLVQVDLSALNPQLKPHVIWPQFNQMDMFNEKPFDDVDAIPYLTEEHNLLNPRRLAKMTEWLDEFSHPSSDQLLSLHQSLPLADEVIVPLDWEEKKGTKRTPSKNQNGSERLNVLFTPAGIVSMDQHKNLEREGVLRKVPRRSSASRWK